VKCKCGEEAVIHGLCDSCFVAQYEDRDYAEYKAMKLKKMARKITRGRKLATTS